MTTRLCQSSSAEDNPLALTNTDEPMYWANLEKDEPTYTEVYRVWTSHLDHIDFHSYQKAWEFSESLFWTEGITCVVEHHYIPNQ